jgi:hypothetical protein
MMVLLYKALMANQVRDNDNDRASHSLIVVVLVVVVVVVVGDDRRDEFVLLEPAQRNQRVTLYLELACNELFGNSKWNVGPCEPDPTRAYSLKQCEIAIMNKEVWHLLWDFIVISDIAKVSVWHSMAALPS